MSERKEYAKARHREIKKELIANNPGIEEKYCGAGCYSISIDEKIVYIGESRFLLNRIVEHLYQIELKNSKQNIYKVLREAYLKGHNVSFDVIYRTKRVKMKTIENDIRKKEGVLIRRYKPVLNYKIPQVKDYNKYIKNERAKTITLDEILCS